MVCSVEIMVSIFVEVNYNEFLHFPEYEQLPNPPKYLPTLSKYVPLKYLLLHTSWLMYELYPSFTTTKPHLVTIFSLSKLKRASTSVDTKPGTTSRIALPNNTFNLSNTTSNNFFLSSFSCSYSINLIHSIYFTILNSTTNKTTILWLKRSFQTINHSSIKSNTSNSDL